VFTSEQGEDVRGPHSDEKPGDVEVRVWEAPDGFAYRAWWWAGLGPTSAQPAPQATPADVDRGEGEWFLYFDRVVDGVRLGPVFVDKERVFLPIAELEEAVLADAWARIHQQAAAAHGTGGEA
jgi:hypothetical protein